MHGYGVYNTSGLFTPIAYSNDKVLEAVQYKNKFILGIQFHIELEKNNKIIRHFIENIKSKK